MCLSACCVFLEIAQYRSVQHPQEVVDLLGSQAMTQETGYDLRIRVLCQKVKEKFGAGCASP